MSPAAGSTRRGSVERASPDRGSVTAELALGLPAVVLALVVVLLVGGAALAQVRCGDAARAGARAAALGEDPATVVALAQELAGPDAQVTVTTADGWARVTVSRPVASRWLGGGSLTARAEFAVPLEPGAAGAGPPGTTTETGSPGAGRGPWSAVAGEQAAGAVDPGPGVGGLG